MNARMYMRIGSAVTVAMKNSKFKTIKFSHDYEKLPTDWVGTQAKLVGVCTEKVAFTLPEELTEPSLEMFK